MSEVNAPDAGITLLSASDLAVAAGGVTLLRGVSLGLNAGELLGVSGPSGCGKSTLLRVLGGLIDSPTGAVLHRGEELVHKGWPAFRRKVVLVNQLPVLLDLSVEENIARPFTYASSSDSFPRERAVALLDRLDVGSQRMAQAARSLSVGQQQRVCLVRAMLLRPDVLLLDEPTSALDEESVGLVEKFVADSVADGDCGAALVVTHDHGQIERWCDRVLDLTSCVVASSAGAVS